MYADLTGNREKRGIKSLRDNRVRILYDAFILNEKKAAIYYNGASLVGTTALKSLTIGSLTLNPAFAGDTTTYTAATTNATNTITAVAESGDATIEIKNGATAVANGASATWSAGANTLTVKVTSPAGDSTTYTVTVTKS